MWGKSPNMCMHKILDDRIEKSIKGRWIHLAQSALARLLWLLYRPGSTHRPHMYPTPGRAWGIGVVGGCARAVPARPPSPLSISRLLRYSSLRRGNLTLRNDDVGIVLFFSIIYNSLRVCIKCANTCIQSNTLIDNVNTSSYYNNNKTPLVR